MWYAQTGSQSSCPQRTTTLLLPLFCPLFFSWVALVFLISDPLVARKKADSKQDCRRGRRRPGALLRHLFSVDPRTEIALAQARRHRSLVLAFGYVFNRRTDGVSRPEEEEPHDNEQGKRRWSCGGGFPDGSQSNNTGFPLELTISNTGERVDGVHVLGPDLAADQKLQVVVPKSAWQTARWVLFFRLSDTHARSLLFFSFVFGMGFWVGSLWYGSLFLVISLFFLRALLCRRWAACIRLGFAWVYDFLHM